MRHARRLFLIVLTATFLVAPASRALAEGAAAPASPTQSFTCVGTVVSASPGSVTVAVHHASLALQGALGRHLSLTVTAGSAITLISGGRTTVVAAADLPAGDTISVLGTVDATSAPGSTLFDVTAATAWRPRVLGGFLCVGTVASVCPQPGAQSLVVTVGSGSSRMGVSPGATVRVDVPASAGIYALRHRLATTTTFNDLTSGDLVKITGVADRTDAGVPLFTAARVLATHVAAVDQLTWFALRGVVDGPGPTAGSLLVTLSCGTRAVRADIGAQLVLTATPSSTIRTLAGGVVSTLPAADVTAGESIAVTGCIDRCVPAAPAFDIGRAFVWQDAAS